MGFEPNELTLEVRRQLYWSTKTPTNLPFGAGNMTVFEDLPQQVLFSSDMGCLCMEIAASRKLHDWSYGLRRRTNGGVSVDRRRCLTLWISVDRPSHAWFSLQQSAESNEPMLLTTRNFTTEGLSCWPYAKSMPASI